MKTKPEKKEKKIPRIPKVIGELAEKIVGKLYTPPPMSPKLLEQEKKRIMPLLEQFLDEQLTKKEEEVLNSKKKRVVLVLEFSVDANGIPQIVETWDYDKKILNQFTSMQLGVIILGLLEEKRKHHKNFLPLIERFCEIFLAHYKTQTKK